MNEDFSRSVIIITGAGAGIGLTVARRLVEEGYAVVLNDLDDNLATSASKKLNEQGPGSCLAFPGNAGSVEFIRSIVAHTYRQYGRIDGIIANAGITAFGRFLDFNENDFQKLMDINLRGSFFLTQAAAKVMCEQGRGGRILLLSSVIGMRAYPYLTAYAMTKAALRMMARSLVLELSPLGININAIAPGAILTERTTDEAPDYAGIWSQLNPNQRVGMPEDVAETVLFLLSPGARHINGQTIVIDGGWSGVGRNPKNISIPNRNEIKN